MPEFSAPVQGEIDVFVNGLSTGGKRGLMVVGPRRSGTTTLARHAVDEVMNATGITTGKGIFAVKLEGAQRAVWQQEALLRANATDFPLWQEVTAGVDAWEAMWKVPILFVDDILVVDAEFWKKHLLIHLDQRLKNKELVTIFAATHLDFFGSDWASAFISMCHVIRLAPR